MKLFVDETTAPEGLPSSRSSSGRKCQAAQPTQSASVERSRLMPLPGVDLRCLMRVPPSQTVRLTL